jgi:hypothetical protein
MPSPESPMTFRHQQHWLRQERARCEGLLAETMVIGGTILDKARADLAALMALQGSLERLGHLESPSLFERSL